VTLGDFPLTIVATSSNSPHTSTITLAVHAADSDGDGIPDWWTQQYFGHPTGQGSDRSQADQDADGTGQNNLFKYVAGLDPTNPTSVFSLSITNVANVPYLIFSPVVSGRLYTIQSSTTLQSSSWTPLPSVGGPVTNGNTVTVTDPNASPQREFYRLDITLP
jgi:hypothetical protein